LLEGTSLVAEGRGGERWGEKEVVVKGRGDSVE